MERMGNKTVTGLQRNVENFLKFNRLNCWDINFNFYPDVWIKKKLEPNVIIFLRNEKWVKCKKKNTKNLSAKIMNDHFKLLAFAICCCFYFCHFFATANNNNLLPFNVSVVCNALKQMKMRLCFISIFTLRVYFVWKLKFIS